MRFVSRLYNQNQENYNLNVIELLDSSDQINVPDIGLADASSIVFNQERI